MNLYYNVHYGYLLPFTIYSDSVNKHICQSQGPLLQLLFLLTSFPRTKAHVIMLSF